MKAIKLMLKFKLTTMLGKGETPPVFNYLRPDGSSLYLRPDGTSTYKHY